MASDFYTLFTSSYISYFSSLSTVVTIGPDCLETACPRPNCYDLFALSLVIVKVTAHTRYPKWWGLGSENYHTLIIQCISAIRTKRNYPALTNSQWEFCTIPSISFSCVRVYLYLTARLEGHCFT